MKTLEDRLREDRRLVMLRILGESPGFARNSSQLHAGLEYFAIRISRADLLADVRWLADQGLIAIAPVADGVYACTLTHAGTDVMDGATQVMGVARPRQR